MFLQQVMGPEDWGEDKLDRKSTSGFILKFHGGTICQSTAEAEYLALVKTS